MTPPQIHGKRRSFSVSDALDTLGNDLKLIREEDKLTWADVGRVLGKSDDRAQDYAKGLSEMGFTAFLLGALEWKGRFTGNVMAMIGQQMAALDAADMSDNERLAKLLHLAHMLSLALLDDGQVDDDELRGIGSAALDDAIRGLTALRARLSILEPTPLRAVASE